MFLLVNSPWGVIRLSECHQYLKQFLKVYHKLNFDLVNMVWKLIERPTKEWVEGWMIRSRWQLLPPRPASPPILWFWPFTFIWVVYSRQTAKLWGQRHLSIPHSLFLIKMKSYVFIFLWRFINPEMFGISAFAEQALGIMVQPSACTAPHLQQLVSENGEPSNTRTHQSTSTLVSFVFEVSSCLGGEK